MGAATGDGVGDAETDADGLGEVGELTDGEGAGEGMRKHPLAVNGTETAMLTAASRRNAPRADMSYPSRFEYGCHSLLAHGNSGLEPGEDGTSFPQCPSEITVSGAPVFPPIWPEAVKVRAAHRGRFLGSRELH
jgi:hypothetical protein